MIVTCPQCQAGNRVPNLPTSRICCGKCKRLLTPADLAKGRHEAPPVRQEVGTDPEFDLDAECDQFRPDPEDPEYCLVCGEEKHAHI